MRLLKLCFFVCAALIQVELKAQPLHPFHVNPTGNNHTLFIKVSASPAIEGVPLQAGDLIGVFFATENGTACGGFTEWQNEDTFITAYGDDGTLPGFQPGEKFQFKILRKQNNCLIENVEVTFVTGGIATDTDSFVSNGISEIGSLNGIPPVELMKMKVTVYPTCDSGGTIAISYSNSLANVLFTLTETSNGNSQSFQTFEVSNVPEGTYKLVISYECDFEWPEPVVVTKSTDCDVISPNYDGIADDYFIPFQGVTKIYNRNGVLIKELLTPARWDGTDQSGEPLPMGAYVLVTDGHAEIMVTIIR